MIVRTGGLALDLQLESGRLELRFGGGDRLELRLPRHLVPDPRVVARPRIEAPPLVARGRIKTPGGAAERLEILTPGPGATRRLVLEVEASGEAVVVALDAPGQPGSDAPIELAGPSTVERADPDGAWLVLRGRERWLLCGLLSGDGASLSSTGEGWQVPSGLRLWLHAGAGPEAVLEAWADRVAAERGARLVPRGGVAWPGGGRSKALHLRAAELPDPIGEDPAPGAVGRQAVRRVRDLAAHAHESARLWHLTPASVAAAPHDRPRLESELAQASLGGFADLASAPDDWSAEALACARRALPPLARTIRPLPGGGLVAPLRHGRLAVWLGNPGDEPAALGIAADVMAALGPGPFDAYDFWPDRVLGRIDTEVPAVPVPPGGCRLLGLSPPSANPAVIGSSLHLGMGTLEVAQLAWQADRWLLRLRHPGHHEGNVWIQHPNDASPLRVPVVFDDQTEVEADLPPPTGFSECP